MCSGRARAEWFFNRSTRTLYFYANSTSDPPPKDLQFVVPTLHRLITIVGTRAQPVRNVTLRGLGLRDSRYTYMEPWGVPSGGDWGLYRGGAILLENCVGCAVSDSTFERIDGNGVMVSGYTRNVSLADNEFLWIGDSAMAAWGYTNENDGTDGLQPRFTSVVRNFVREIGLIEKQSSMWFQAKSCQSVIEKNIVFNGPRAAINFNDGEEKGGVG